MVTMIRDKDLFKSHTDDFIKYLVNDKNFKHSSIARAVGLGSSNRLHSFTLRDKKAIKLMQVYVNNYIVWCKNINIPMEDTIYKYYLETYGENKEV